MTMNNGSSTLPVLTEREYSQLRAMLAQTDYKPFRTGYDRPSYNVTDDCSKGSVIHYKLPVGTTRDEALSNYADIISVTSALYDQDNNEIIFYRSTVERLVEEYDYKARMMNLLVEIATQVTDLRKELTIRAATETEGSRQEHGALELSPEVVKVVKA